MVSREIYWTSLYDIWIRCYHKQEAEGNPASSFGGRFDVENKQSSIENLTALLQCEGKAFFLESFGVPSCQRSICLRVVVEEVEKSTNFEPDEDVVSCSRPLYNCAPSKM